MHHIRPKNIALITMAGHQYDQTIKLPRFVFRNCLRKAESVEYAINPVTINIIYAMSDRNFNEIGKYHLCNKLLIIFISR